VADTITVKFKIMEDGSLKAVGKDADRAAAALDKTSKSTDKATRSADKYSKKNKGVAGATSNSTKAFSKMTSGISGGLVPAYATLAANVFALTAAFGLLARNDAISKLNQGLEHTGAVAGRNLTMVADKLKEISGNAISAEQSMRAVAVGVSAGFSEDQLTSLTRVAKGASLALGRDMGDAMDRLIRGAAKLEPEILDELGIMVRLDDATTKYAESVNKSASELTQFERRMAFTNAIIADGEKKFQSIQAALDPSEYGQLSATFSDLTKSFVQLLNSGLGPVFGFLSQNKAALAALIVSFGASISKDLVGSIESHTKAAAKNAKAAAHQSKVNLKNIKVTDSMTKNMKGLANAEKMSVDQLKKLHRLSNQQVNLMNKSNSQYKTAVQTRRSLTMATFALTTATHKQGMADAIGMLQTEGFTAARAKYLLVQSQTATATAAATVGQDALTLAMIRGKAAALAAGSAIKFYGTALLIAFPMIMAITTAVAVLGPMLFGLFKSPEDGLSKQLKKNEERLKSFQKVIRVYTESIRTAETATEAWFKTIKPLSGLFDQVSSAMKDTNLEAETKLIVAQAKARQDLARAKKFEKSINKGEFRAQTGYGMSVSAQQVTNSEEAQEAISKAKALSQKDLNSIKDTNIKLISGLIASMDQMQVAMEDDKKNTYLQRNAMRTLTIARTEAQTVLDSLIVTEFKSLKQAENIQKQIQKTTDKLTAGTAAYESFNEVVTKANNLNATKTFGLFAEKIDNVTDAVKELNGIAATEKGDTLATKLLNSAAAEQEAEKIIKAYGLVKKTFLTEVGSFGVINEDGTETIGAEIMPMVEKATDAVKRFEKDLQKVSKDAKKLEVTVANTALIESALGEDSSYVFEKNLLNTQEQLRIKKEAYRLETKGGQDELTARLEVLAVEREILALTKKRMDTLASRAEQSGMGFGTAAVIRGQGNRAATDAAGKATILDAQNATYKEKKDKDGNVVGPTAQEQRATAVAGAKAQADAANLAAKKETAKNAMSGIAKDIAALGPEGALMSSAIQGALDVQTAFSTAFEAMAADGATMSDKISAGIGATMALVSALSATAKAASDQKIMGIDNEIARERQRDGASAASINKIKALEAKKEQEKKKAFEQDKKMKRAQTIMATAQAVMQAFAMGGPIVGAIMSAFIIALGAKQLSLINSQTYTGGGGGASGGTPSVSAGSRSNTVDLATSNNAGGELAYSRGAEGTGNMSNFKPAFSGYKHRASGGYIVGEQGPEIFMPDTPGEIISSGKTPEGQTNVNFSINAVDAAGVEDLLINQRGNIIGMIREAANEHGELFLESVREKSY